MRRQYILSRSNKISPYRGLTILEMVLAMSITAIVFTAIAPQFHSIQNSWAAKQTTSRIIQNGRVLIDHLNRNLTKAVKVTTVTNSSETNGQIVFEDNNGISCGYDVANNYVRFGSEGWYDDLAGPVSQLRFTCYSLDDFVTATTDVEAIRLVKVEITFTNPSSTGQDRDFKTSVYLRTNGNPPTDLEPGVAIAQLINYSQWAVFDSYNSSAGPYGPGNSSSSAIVTVNAIGNKKIVLQDDTILYGDAYIGPGGNVNTGIRTWNNAVITGIKGVLTKAVTMPTHTAPTGSPFDGIDEGDYELINSETDTISSDRYFNNLRLEDDAVLTISGDVTILTENNFEVTGNAELRILPDSSLNLYTFGACTVQGNAEVNANTADPTRLNIYMLDYERAFTLETNGQVHGVLQNTKGNVITNNTAQFYGKIKAQRLDGYNNSAIHVDLDSDFGDYSGQILP